MGVLAPLWARISENTFARYAVALGATALALLIRWALNPVLGNSVPYAILFPAIAFSAYFCGVGPSVVAIILCLSATRFWFVSPMHSFRNPELAQLIGGLAFLLASGIAVSIGELSRRKTEVFRLAQRELEERVEQRTRELREANHSLGELTGRLLQLQDDERRRIARELHDSVGQTLAALSMNLSTVAADIDRLTKTAGTVADSAALVKDMSGDIRTISYLLHPPLLDEAGLSSALRWYIEGFAERSKIRATLEFPDGFGRLSRELETAIFRVVQECLTNIHRHSESPMATVRISRSATDVWIEVEDKGKGLSPEKGAEIASTGTVGVGIRGMRERMRQLGGSLEICSDGIGKGTVVMARLPVPPTISSGLGCEPVSPSEPTTSPAFSLETNSRSRSCGS
jgi:signal transduction histidine kinase